MSEYIKTLMLEIFNKMSDKAVKITIEIKPKETQKIKKKARVITTATQK